MSYTVVTFSSHGRAISLALSLSGCGTNVVAPIGPGPQGDGGDAEGGSGGAGGAGAAGTTAAGGSLGLGLIAYWKLDEGSADEPALDSVGQHMATPVNDPPPTDDAPALGFGNSGSRSFDGQGQYLRIASTDDLNFIGEISLAAWVKLAALGDDCQYVIGHGYCLSPPGEVVLRVGVPGCGPSQEPHSWNAGAYLSGEYSAAAPVLESDVGVWVHVAGTYASADQTWRLYRNGQEIAMQPSVVGAVPVQNDWSIGARAPGLPPCMPQGPERYFNGLIDEVRIYRRALSGSEIEELYHL